MQTIMARSRNPLCHLWLLGLMILMTAQHAAGTTIGKSTSESLVRSEFDRSDQARRFDINSSPSSGSLELCGDTCDVFAWSRPRKMVEVWDFVLLYEYERGIGSQLEGITETYKPRVESVIPSVVDRYKPYCPLQPSTSQLASCVLKALARRNKIRIGYVSYDEGMRCVSWGDLRDRSKMSKAQCNPVQAPKRQKSNL
jgi:hypothetical protein